MIIFLLSVLIDGNFLLSEFAFGRSVGWWFAAICELSHALSLVYSLCSLFSMIFAVRGGVAVVLAVAHSFIPQSVSLHIWLCCKHS